MHISAILFYGPDSDLIIQRFYRADVKKVSTEAFRVNVVAARDFHEPVLMIDNCHFMYLRENGVTIAAATRKNSNAVLVFQFLYQLLDVFKAYFGDEISKASLQANFTLIYELLDEVMDYGFPQILSTNILKQYIMVGNVKGRPQDMSGSGAQSITSEITGAIDWRKANTHKYRKNEVFIDVLESVNYITSAYGAQLRADVSGKILMKTYLSGMPECKFGMNDKLMLDRTKRPGAQGSGNRTIAIDDVTFHRCVRLGKFEQDRTISFIPPDGEFDLMQYRITQNIKLPFEVTANVEEMGRNRVEYNVQVKATFRAKINATEVVLNIPCPTNTSKAKIHMCTAGKAKYNPAAHCIVWKIKRFAGDQSFQLKGEVSRTHLIKDKAWSRPPITMDFQVPMYASSGLEVKFLKVQERSNYQTIKWVRYITKAGTYAIRI